MKSGAFPDLNGRVAIVSGGSGGLGSAILETLKAAGATTVSFDRSPSTALDQPTLFQSCDVTDEASVTTAVSAVIERFRRIDILVANAGVQGPIKHVSELTASEWRQTLDINLTGTFLSARAVAPVMTAQQYGRIIFMSSVQGKEGTAGAGAYAASKAGLIALAKVMSKELATSGVTVNCITPTVVDVGMYVEIDEARRRDLIAKIPMGRPCSAGEVAAMVAFVASDACSFSTGAVFDLSGGRATW
jgi:NAD(P)-dependent dehydrogenase (short-subunit alcohol dehydrogenase family)